MFDSRQFLPLLLTFVLLSLLVALLKKGAEEFYPQLLGEEGGPQRQARTERVFKVAEVPSKILTIGGDEHEPLLYGPLQMKLTPEDHVMVVDYGDLLIKEFSHGGELIQTYGAGKGQGPGEFVSITDFFTTADGEVWVVDSSNGKIVVFDRRGAILRTLKTELQPYRLLVDPADGILLMLPPLGPRLFQRLGPTGEKLESFGVLIENQLRDGLILDGWIEPDLTGAFIYASRYAGLLAAYSMRGERRFLVRMIEPPDLPKLLQDAEGRRWVDREALPSAGSLSVAGDEIHVLSPFLDGLQRKGAIDTYSLSDGSYLYSRRNPEPCYQVVMTEDSIYTVGDVTITKWHRTP